MKNKQQGFIVPVLIIIIVILIAGGVYIYKSKKTETPAEVQLVNQVQQTNIQNDNKIEIKSSPEVLVKDYYQNVIDNLNNKVATDLSLDLNYVTQNIINNFELLKKNNPNGIPYNPFICAQDFPDDASELKIRTITNSNFKATVQAEIFKGSPITLSLVNDNGWKIDEITCSSRD